MSEQDFSERPLFVERSVKPPTYANVLGLICIVIALAVTITAVCLFAFTGRVVPFDYGIVIDAGSSHTQSFLYRWYGSKDSGTGVVLQEDTCTYDHGIASIPDPADIVKCTEKVVNSIPSAAKAQTPLYLGATAGMRLLNITSSSEAALRLLTLKYALKRTQVDVKDVSIITGYNEGMYAWITVNFLADTLNPKKASHAWNITYGALDLGGASTQFAYAVNPEIPHNSAEFTTLKLYGSKYGILSESFLCFGVDQALIRHQALLINDLNSTEIITDPCLPKGNISSVEASFLLGGPCTSTPEFKKWLQIFSSTNKTFTFQGGSDFEKCKKSIDVLLNASFCEKKGFTRCSRTVNISNSGVKFMAFSSFSYVLSFLNATHASLKDVVDITTKWCELSWEQIDPDKYEPYVRRHLAKYCFGAVYIIQWLKLNYGFDETSWKNLIFQDKIGTSDIGWSLGYMIDATNTIPEEKMVEPSISVAVLVILVICSAILGIFGLAFLFKCKIFGKSRTYSRLED